MYDVVVIGGGPAGYVASIKSAQHGFKTLCVEKDSTLGGTCLNVGCIPSKSLLHMTEISSDVDLIFDRKDKIVDKLTKGINFLFKKYGVESLRGHASFVGDAIAVDGKKIASKKIIIATGSTPIELPFLAFDGKKVLSSTDLLSLRKRPKNMTVIGGGVIGLEIGIIYSRLGTSVKILEARDRLISEFDDDISKVCKKILEDRGIEIVLNNAIDKDYKDDSEVILVAIGRKPYTEGLQLDEAGIERDDRGFIKVNGYFRTSVEHVYAIGDVIGNPMLAHKGSGEAIALINYFSGNFHSINYLTIPNVIYTSPEVASVGFSERYLKNRGVEYKSSIFQFKGNSRYQSVEGRDPCFVKMLSDKSGNKLLGCHIISLHGGEMIAHPSLVIQEGIPLKRVESFLFAHPTLSEALHECYLGLNGAFTHM